MNSLKFIKLVYDRKEPIKDQSFKDTKELKDIDITKYNIGLVAGANNLIILDIDEKDGGLIEWGDYLKENFEPYTMKHRSLGGGYHYLFKHYDDTYTDEENEAIKQLKNKSKYRNKGIDIRKGNGYIVFQPSKINKETYKKYYGSGAIYPKYEEYKLMNDIQPHKMPLKLINWLLEFESKEKEALNNNLVLINNVDELEAILDKLINVSSRQWFNITTAVKNLLHSYNDLDEDEIKGIWKKWSKKNDGYDKQNNIKIWDGITSNINMNFVISQFNKKQPKETYIKLLESFKLLEPLQKPEDIPMITINNKYIYDEHYKGEQFNKVIFNKYDTIIIKSTTGTGKTSNTARHIEEYIKDHSEFKFMSIVNLRTLSHQHIESFKNINIVSYENKDELNKEDNNIVICLNSLMMYSTYNGDFFKNYIVYIDEITSLINSLTHNNTLDKSLKGVYIVLMKIMKNAHKVIVSDATINNNTFTFLNKRTNNIYIDNIYKKYEGLTVYKMNDENEFLNEIKKHVKNKKYFLFGGDSLNLTSKYYYKTITKDDDIEQSELITSNDKLIITDATKQFKNKFVFYSPSITTGIDFSIDTPQDVFIYINGKSINPDASFQQMSRTRNIKNVYVYISETDSKTAKYNTIEETKEHIKTISKNEKDNSNINKMCISFIDDEYIFNDNAYFSLFTFNEYVKDAYETNKKQHFYNILLENGFKIIQKGTTTKLNKKTMKEMKETYNKKEDARFEKHIERMKEQTPESEVKEMTSATPATKEREKEEEETKILKMSMEYLQIEDIKTAIQYKDIIIDKYKREDYFNLIKLLRPETKILYKVKEANNNTTSYKIIYSTYYKISLIWQLEKELNINRFQFNKLDDDKPYKITDELIKKINVSFKSEQYPTTYNEYIEYYVNKINHITGDIKIISTTRKRVKGARQQIYSVNREELNKYVELYKLSDERRQYLLKCEYFNELTTKQEPKQDINDTNETEPDFIDELEVNFKTSFYKANYPLSCIEYTMSDKELINIGWSKTNIEDFKTYKSMM